MPKYFKTSDPDYFDAITPPEMRWAGAATREVMPGWDLGSIVMGDDPADPDVPVASMLRIAPGDTLPRHAHDCFRVEVVVQGSISLPNGEVLHPGDIMTSSPREHYGPHIAGPDGCLSVEIFSAARGTAPIADDEDTHAADVANRVNEATSRLQSKAVSSNTPS
jgi:anti-sigma factor ChrR (cupin superfamily)